MYKYDCELSMIQNQMVLLWFAVAVFYRAFFFITNSFFCLKQIIVFIVIAIFVTLASSSDIGF